MGSTVGPAGSVGGLVGGGILGDMAGRRVGGLIWDLNWDCIAKHEAEENCAEATFIVSGGLTPETLELYRSSGGSPPVAGLLSAVPQAASTDDPLYIP